MLKQSREVIFKKVTPFIHKMCYVILLRYEELVGVESNTPGSRTCRSHGLSSKVAVTENEAFFTAHEELVSIKRRSRRTMASEESSGQVKCLICNIFVSFIVSVLLMGLTYHRNFVFCN